MHDTITKVFGGGQLDTYGELYEDMGIHQDSLYGLLHRDYRNYQSIGIANPPQA
jgi:hypothetical protein